MLRALVLLLAAVRLTEIISFEKIMQPLRELAGILHADSGEIIAYDEGFLSSLLSCYRCLSVWVSTFVVAAAAVPQLYKFLLTPLALSWVAYRLYGWANDDEDATD